MLRGHVRGIVEKEPALLNLIDPQGGRFAAWAEDRHIQYVIENIIKEATDKMLAEGIPFLKKGEFGDVEPGQENHINKLRSNYGWKYVAAEKFPSDIHYAVFKSECAARTGVYKNEKTGLVVEHNSVLCHPALADFVLCRMARQASIVEYLPSITFGGTNYMDHLLDGEPRANGPQQELMQATLGLFVPDNLSLLTVEDFITARSEYSTIRRLVADYLSSLIAAENLNMTPINQGVFFDRLISTRQKIEREMNDVANQIGRHRFLHGSAISLEAASTLIGAAVGSIYSGVAGAMSGSTIGLAGGKFAHRLSTLGEVHGQLRSIAMTKAKVERMGVRKRWNAPSHWIQ